MNEKLTDIHPCWNISLKWMKSWQKNIHPSWIFFYSWIPTSRDYDCRDSDCRDFETLPFLIYCVCLPVPLLPLRKMNDPDMILFYFSFYWRFSFSLEKSGHDSCHRKGQTASPKRMKLRKSSKRPPPHLWKIILRISRQNCEKSAYVHYGGTVLYYMILFTMRCM